jgi:hypothetical protein
MYAGPTDDFHLFHLAERLGLTVEQYRDLLARRERQRKRAIAREHRHEAFRKNERKKNRASLKALGLATNVHDWPGAA